MGYGGPSLAEQKGLGNDASVCLSAGSTDKRIIRRYRFHGGWDREGVILHMVGAQRHSRPKPREYFARAHHRLTLGTLDVHLDEMNRGQLELAGNFIDRRDLDPDIARLRRLIAKHDRISRRISLIHMECQLATLIPH